MVSKKEKHPHTEINGEIYECVICIYISPLIVDSPMGICKRKKLGVLKDKIDCHMKIKKFVTTQRK